MSNQPTCAKCGEDYSLPFGFEPTKYCDACAHGLAQELEEENKQFRNEIEALQRRLAEYAGELERVRAQCAAMRSALENAAGWLDAGSGNQELDQCAAQVQATLSTDAGKGYVPAAEHEEEKRRALIAGEDEADGDWLAAIQSQDWGGEISLAEGNEIASDGRNEIIASIHERFEELKKNTVPADKARVIAEGLNALYAVQVASDAYNSDFYEKYAALMVSVKKAIAVALELGLLSIPTVAATGKPITPEELEDKL